MWAAFRSRSDSCPRRVFSFVIPARSQPQGAVHYEATRISNFNPRARGGRPMTMPQSNLVASNSIDCATFEGLYAGPAPWDIGKPQPQFTAIADRVTGPILDAGCGTGEHALFFAARGHRVVGIDFVEEAIRRAR